MLLLAHVFGMPFEELVNPMVSVMTPTAAIFLVGAFTSRWRRLKRQEAAPVAPTQQTP